MSALLQFGARAPGRPRKCQTEEEKREAIRRRQRRAAALHPEAARERYYSHHGDRIAYSRRFYEENKERMREKGRQYYQTHKDRYKAYYQTHKNIIEQQRRVKGSGGVLDVETGRVSPSPPAPRPRGRPRMYP